jgi:thiol-disulfide isomerase/thioredoxin/outer membrane lipoprotein-sorting protein
MSSRNTFVVTLLAAFLFAPSALQAQFPPFDPAEVIGRLEEKSANAATYEFEGVLQLEGQRGDDPVRLLTRAKIHFAVSEPGQYYLNLDTPEHGEYTLISNGEKSWAYVPKLKKYTEQEGAVLLDTDDTGAGGSDDERDLAEAFAHQVMPIFSELRTSAAAVDIDGVAKVKYDGQRHNWPIIRVMTKDTPPNGRSLIELTMHPATLRVARLVWTNVSYPNEEKTLLRMSVDFDRLSIAEPLPADTFVFTPPKKAKLADAVPIPGQTGSFLLHQPAPELSLKTLDGERITLSELRGRPVMLAFWASWCGPCRRELPTIIELEQEYKDRGLVVLGVNDEGKGPARKYAREAGLSFPTLDDTSRKAHRGYRVRSIPTTFLIDADGKIVRFFSGAKDEETLRSALAAVGL